MISGPEPLWIEAAVFGWRSFAFTNSTFTWAPVSFVKPSWICCLKSSSQAGTKLVHCSTDRVVPLRLAGALAAGAAWVGWAPAGALVAPGFAASVGLAAGAVVAAGLDSAGLAGAWVAPPQALRSSRPVVPTVACKNFRRVR